MIFLVVCLLSVAYNGCAGADFDADAELERLKDKDFVRDREHLRHHLEGTVDFDPDNASPEELEFHFFRIHDLNNDNLLDGIEILSALYHATEEQMSMIQRKNVGNDPNLRVTRFKEHLVRVVDRMLEQDDIDNDGYLSYTEFVYSKRAKKVLQDAENPKPTLYG